MSIKPNGLTRLYTYQKYIGIFCIVCAIPMLLLDVHKDTLLLAGLFMLFTAPDKYNDERGVGLKMSSLYFSVMLAYGMSMMIQHLYSYQLLVSHFLIFVFALSLIIYYIRFYTFR